MYRYRVEVLPEEGGNVETTYYISANASISKKELQVAALVLNGGMPKEWIEQQLPNAEGYVAVFPEPNTMHET